MLGKHGISSVMCPGKVRKMSTDFTISCMLVLLNAI